MKPVKSSHSQPRLRKNSSTSMHSNNQDVDQRSSPTTPKVWGSWKQKTLSLKTGPLRPDQSIHPQSAGAEDRLRRFKKLSKSGTVSHVDNVRMIRQRHASQTLNDPGVNFKPLSSIEKLYNFKVK